MLGRWLREAREKADLSQAEVARRAGIDRSYLSDLERDKQSPTMQLFLRICRAMQVSAAEIVGKMEDSDSEKGRERR